MDQKNYQLNWRILSYPLYRSGLHSMGLIIRVRVTSISILSAECSVIMMFLILYYIALEWDEAKSQFQNFMITWLSIRDGAGAANPKNAIAG